MTVEITDQMREEAATNMAWMKAYIEAGFTREEFMRICVAWNSRPVIHAPTSVSPDLAELMEKTRLIADQTLLDMNGGE